jgi:flavin reductase (DIM6/NTAB) family NADH-FMN oxidoreductase RutF
MTPGAATLPLPGPADAGSQIAERSFRSAMGLFTTGVCVLTTLRGRHGRGMTANSFTAVSLDPMLVLVCIRHDSEMCRLVTDLGTFAVSILARDQRDAAAWFADPGRPPGRRQFDAVGWRPGAMTGVPVLDRALAWVECDVAELVPAGDHVVVIGKVLGFGQNPGRLPLTFTAGRYGTVTGDG